MDGVLHVGGGCAGGDGGLGGGGLGGGGLGGGGGDCAGARTSDTSTTKASSRRDEVRRCCTGAGDAMARSNEHQAATLRGANGPRVKRVLRTSACKRVFAG